MRRRELQGSLGVVFGTLATTRLANGKRDFVITKINTLLGNQRHRMEMAKLARKPKPYDAKAYRELMENSERRRQYAIAKKKRRQNAASGHD